MVVAHRLLERLQGLVDGVLFEEDFGGGAPDHHEPVAAVLALKLGDLLDKLVRQIELVLALLDVRAGQPLDVVLIKDGLHRPDLLELRLELRQQFFFKHARRQRRLVGRVGEDVPRAEDDVVEGGERDELLDEGVAVLGPLAEADRAHLREAADGVGQAALDGLDARDEGRADGPEADEQHAELALGRRDLEAVLPGLRGSVLFC
jgi:hypothetical protein